MESYLNENFGEVRAKNSSEEALQRWRNLCGVVKNPKRRFRFTANLSKRNEAGIDFVREWNETALKEALAILTPILEDRVRIAEAKSEEVNMRVVQFMTATELINDDGVDVVSSSSSDRWLSDYDHEI